MDNKICPKCKIEKSSIEFSKCTARKDGFKLYCKTCENISAQVYYQKNRQREIKRVQKYWSTHRDQKRNNDLKLKYGITLDDYNKLFEEQQGCCAICGIHNSELKCPLGVDHNHITEKIRGLLCRECNSAIGKLKSDYGTDLLKVAINYIEKR